MKKDPNYHPNTHSWKVFVVDRNNNERQVRSYTTQEKAIAYATKQNDNRLYRIRQVKI